MSDEEIHGGAVPRGKFGSDTGVYVLELASER